MAKLPGYTQRQVIAQEATPGAAPVDRSMAQATKSLGAGLMNLAQAQNQMMQREARDYTLESQNQTTVGLSEEKNRLTETAMNGSEYTEGIKTYIQSQKQEAIDKAPSARAAEEVSAYYDKLEAAELRNAIPVAARMNAERSAAAVKNNIDISLNQTYREPATFDQNLQSGIDTIMSSELPENLKPKAIAEYQNNLTVQKILGITNQSPDLALQQLQNGEYDEDLTPSQLATLTNSAKSQAAALERQREIDARNALSEAQRQEDARNAEVQSDLEINVARGEAGYVEIEKAYENGIITPQKRTQLTLKVDSRNEAQQRINLGIEAVSTAINGGQPLDYTNTDHQNAVDAYYANMPTKDMGSILTLVSSTKVIPTQVETSLNAGLRGSSDQRVEASNTIAMLNENAPEAVASLPADTKAMGIGISRLVAAGVDPVKASDLMFNSVYNTTKEEKEVLKTQLTQKDMTNKKINGFKKAVKKISPSFFAPKRTPSMNSMEAEFNTAVNDYYLMTHDIDTAMELATTDIGKVWGSTWVDGKERVMKYAPEKIYGNGQKADWIYRQLESELKLIGVTDKYTLQADAVTAREDKPSYLVMTESDGVMTPLMIDGQIQRYTPDFSITEDAKILEQQKAESMEKARKNEAILKNYGGEFPTPKYGSYGYEVQ